MTCHQPISIPSGPRRGFECQWPQPGRPSSSRPIRTHLKSSGAAIIRASSRRFSPSAAARSASAPRASATRAASSSRVRSNSPSPSIRGGPAGAGTR